MTTIRFDYKTKTYTTAPVSTDTTKNNEDDDDCIIHTELPDISFSFVQAEPNVQTLHNCCQHTREAVSKKHIQCLKELHTIGMLLPETTRARVFTDKTAECAAGIGDLPCLEYCYENRVHFDMGCDVWKDAAAYAAKYNHVSCVQWILTHACSFSNRIFQATVRSGSMDVLLYLYAAYPNHPCFKMDSSVILAVGSGQMDCVKFLLQIGCSINNGCVLYALECNEVECALEILVHLVKRGVKSNPRKIMAKLGEMFAQECYRESVMWEMLHGEHRDELCAWFFNCLEIKDGDIMCKMVAQAVKESRV